MSEIKPALSAEQWARAFRSNPADPALSDSAFEFTDPEARYYLAALALHGHPGGFTWADIDALRAAATLLHVHGCGTETVASLVGRIVALLPPRETP